MMEHDPSIGSGCWYLGQIYFNRDDNRIIVRKKRGCGWTLNFARPLAIPTLIVFSAYALAPFYLLNYFDIENPWALITSFLFVLISLMGFCFWIEKK